MSLYRCAFSRVKVLLLLLAWLMAIPALAVSLKAEKSEIAMGEELIISIADKDSISIATGWATTEQLELLDSNSDQARVKGAKPGRATVTVNINGKPYQTLVKVLANADEKTDDPFFKIQGFVRALGITDVQTRIARLLYEVKNGTRGADSFYAELGKIGGKMTDVIAVRSKLVDNPDSALARQVLGDTYPEGGTLVEQRILNWRKQQTLAAIQTVLKRFAGRSTANGAQLIIAHVGKWAEEDSRALKFPGDIDFSFVSTDEALVRDLKADFLQEIVRRTQLDQFSLDAVATAHGKAGLEVYIGRHGMAFAELQMKFNTIVDLEKGTQRSAKIEEVTEILGAERTLMAAQGQEITQPNWKKEPGLSMEMVRHFDKDIVKTGIYDITTAVVKAAKYLDRSYEALAGADGTPADPKLAAFAKDITALANAKPQSVATRESTVKRIAEFFGSAPTVEFDGATQTLRLKLDAKQIQAFHDAATKAIWKTVEQGSAKRTLELDTRLRDLLDRQRRGETVSEDVAKLRTEMAELVDMVEAEVKAINGGMDIPVSVLTNNAKVRSLMDTLSQRFGTKTLSADELKDKNFVEALLKAELEKPSLSRRKMLKDYIMDRAARSAELAMKGVEKTNQILDFIDDGLLGSLRGDADFADFEKEMQNIRNAAPDSKGKQEAASRLGALRGRVANGIKSTNEYLNKGLQATSAGRQGMKFMAVYGLVDEMQSYRDAFNEQGWGGFATEIFRRRIPLGSAVENVVMGNTYLAAWDVVTTLIPPLGLPMAAYGLGTSLGNSVKSTYWSEQLALFTDTLYDSAKFELKAVEQYNSAKVGEYRLISVKYRGIIMDLSKFADLRKTQVDALRQQIGKGRLDWAKYDQEFQGLTRWTEVDKVLQKNIADTDPALAIIEEMVKDENVGPRLKDRLAEKGIMRWEEVKLGFITNLIKQLEDRKQADQALGAGMLPDMFAELRGIATELGIEPLVLKALDAEVNTNNLKNLMNWLWDAKRSALSQPPTESETTRAAQVVKRYLDAYRLVRTLRETAENQLGSAAFRDGSTTYLTGGYFLTGRAEADLKAAQAWIGHIDQSHAAVDQALLDIKQRYSPNATLNDALDKRYQEYLFPHQLWMKPYRSFAAAHSDNGVLAWAVGHDKERRRLLGEYEKALKSQDIVELSVGLKDSANARITVEDARGKLVPTDALGNPATANGSGILVFTAASGRYQLTVEAPGYEPLSRAVLLGRNLNPRPRVDLEMKPTKQADPKPNAQAAAQLLAKAKTLAERGSFDEAIAAALQAQKLDPENSEIPHWIQKWEQAKQGTKPGDKKDPLPTDPTTKVPVTDSDRVTEEERRRAEEDRLYKERAEKEQLEQEAAAFRAKVEKDRADAERKSREKPYVWSCVPWFCKCVLQSEWKPNDRCPGVGQGGGMCGSASTGQGKSCGSYAPPIDPKELENAALSVSVDAARSAIKPGENTLILALAKGGKGPYRYTWSQNVSGSSDAVRFAETKTGTHTVSVEVTDSKGAKASANTRVSVSNIIASIDGLKAEAAYASKLLLRAIINSQTPDSGAYQIVWQASLPGVAFDPPEGPTTQMTLGRMGPIKIWMQIRERSSGAGADAVVESPQQDVRVVAPMFSWVFDPEKGKGKLGQEIRATLTATPAIHPDLIRFEWAVPASADRREYSKNANAVGFTPKDVKPTALAVDPRVPFYGDPIGDSLTADYEATGYTVTVKGPQPRQVVQMWQCDTQLGRASSCGMKTMENQFAVDQQILFSAGVEPAPEKTVNYAWSLTPEGCTLGAIAGTQTSISCHATGSYTVTAQASVDKIVVGSASGSVTVSISQNDVNSANKAKEAYEKLQKAKELVGQGRLDEGLALADEASKLDAKNAETTALVNKWRAERDSVQGYLRAMDAHIGQQKLDDAQHDLSEAQKLHPKYAPVTDAEKRLKEALRKAEVEKKRLEELKKALEERLARARDLVAQGKLDEGIALADEALRLDPRHAEAQGLTSRWKAEKQMVLQQLEQVRQRVAANQLAEAQNALTQAQKLHPRYAPVLEMEKYLKAAQTQDALKKEVAGKVAKAKDLVLQGKLDEGIGLIDEALKVDPRHAEGNQLAARWKTERQSVAKQVDSIRKLLPANNIVDAEKELAGALKLHPKYGPVVESQKLINDAKKRIAEQQNVERTQKEEQARGLLREASALEQRGDMAGALTKYQESMKVAPTGSAQQNIARLEVQFGQAKQLWDEGKAAFAANNLSGSLAKMKESLRVWPGDREREAYVAQLEQGVRAQQAAQAEAQRLRAQGEVLQQQNQLPAAIAKYRESLKLVPDARLEQHIQTLERQVQAAQQQAQIQLQARNLRAEGEALQQQNQLPAAIVKYRESLKLVPDARLEQHIQTLEHQVQVEQQRQAQIQMQARNLRAEGEALQQQNQLPAAIAKYRESLKLVPDAKLEQHIQTLERQLQAQAQVQAQAQAQAKNLRAQGEMLQQQNRLRDAIAKYRESIAIWPDDALQAHIQKLEQILASAPVTSPVPVPVPTPAPVIARAGTGSWEYVGIGDCPGNDIEGGGPGEVPNPKVCDSGHLGLAAVCWDTHTPRVLSPSSCTVKRVTVENCTGGANPGRMYRCTVSQAGMDPTGVWRHHPEATWTISRTAAGGWFAQESGLGNASGPGNWTPGGSFRIDYVTRDGTIKGYYDVRFSPDGRSATGTVRELNGPQRSGDSQWSRLTGVSPSPIPSPATAAKPGFYPVDLTPYGGKKEAPTIVSDILMDRSSWIRLKHHGEDGHASPKMRLNVAVPSVSPVTSIALNGNLDHAHLVPQGTTITKMTVVANEGSASFDIQAGVHMSEWNGPNKHQVAPTGGGSSYTPVFKLPRPMTVTSIRFDYVEVSTSYDHEGSAPGFCLRGITLVGPGLSPTGSAAPLPATGHAEGGQQSDVLFDNGNIGGVSNQPTRPTAFTLDRPRVVTLIRNYHWNDGRGTPSPGTIALRDGAGHVYGPWPTLGSPGQGGVPNANWTAKPQVQIPAGSYTVIDSSPATWAQNSGSNGAGMTHVEGH
jgi:tetratricopeptide (TPR) repeat protein